eukprot:m.3372 g.3372  ORF g.3372 m.3372 type:complete len:68 (+) comp2757_c0_seq1:30-233(+)
MFQFLFGFLSVDPNLGAVSPMEVDARVVPQRVFPSVTANTAVSGILVTIHSHMYTKPSNILVANVEL